MTEAHADLVRRLRRVAKQDTGETCALLHQAAEAIAACDEPIRAGALCYRDVGPEDFRHTYHGAIPRDQLQSYAPLVPQAQETLIALDAYEVANLRAAIEAVGYPWPGEDGRSPLNVLNSGDWIGQIYNKLPITRHQPNRTPEQYRAEARAASPAPDLRALSEKIRSILRLLENRSINYAVSQDLVKEWADELDAALHAPKEPT